MVNALKLVSVNRGFDPRDFTLVAFGGGGGMHAVALAQELGVRKVVVPVGASVFSAWGMMMSDLRRDYFVTRLADLAPERAGDIEAVFAESRRSGRAGSSPPRGSNRPASRSTDFGQVPLSEPGAHDRGAPRRGARHPGPNRRHRGRLPRDLRARVHLPARGAGRAGRHSSRRGRGGRQAHHGGARAVRGGGGDGAQGLARGRLRPRRGPPRPRSTTASGWRPA